MPNPTHPKAVAASANLSSQPPSGTVSCQQATHTIDASYLYRDHADTPVGEIPYRLTNRQDRSVVVEGVTNKQGKLHEEGLTGGTYDLEYIPQQDAAAHQKAQELRKALTQTINDIILNVQQNTKFQEQVLDELNWAEESLVYTGAFLQGSWDTVASFGEFIGTVGSALYEAEKAYLDIWANIVSGNFDEIERKIESSSEAAKRFFSASEENFEKLVLLVSDRTVRQSLYEFPKRYWDALSSVEQTRMVASIGTDIAIEVLIAVVSGGLAIPAQLAKLGRTSAKLLSKLVDILSELATTLKKIKPRKKKQIAVNTDKTFYVDSKANNRLQQNFGGSSQKPGVNDANKNTSNIENTTDSGEPISMVTGEEVLELNDFTLPGLLPLQWRRVYRSGNDRNQGLGVGWTHPFCEQLSIQDGNVIYSDSEGRHIHLPQPDVGEFTVNDTEGIFLHREYHNIYVIKQKSQPSKIFIGNTEAKISALTDKRGHAWNCFYDQGSGALIELKSSWGSSVRIDYEKHQITRISLVPKSHHPIQLAAYQYNDTFDLVTAFDRSHHPEYYQYKNHMLVQRTLKSGYSFYLKWDQYNKYGKCIEQWGDNGNYHYKFEWDEDNRISKSIDSNGGVLEVHYNESGLTTKEISPGGGVTLFEYDDCQRLIKKTNPNGHEFEYKYDDLGNLTAYLDPAGGGYAITYDEDYNPIEYSDALGNSWLNEYDEQGLIAKTTTPEGFETQYFYNENGLPITIINADGNKRFLEWDEQGNLIADSHGIDNLNSPGISQYQHNVLGQVTQVINGSTQTTYEYNISGNITGIHYPDGRKTALAYNASGQLTCYTDSAGRKTQFEYDGLAQITKRTNALGHSFRYHYDAERNLVGLTNEKGEQYHLAYDADERLIKEVGFDGRVQQYQYDSAGFLTQHIEGDHADTDTKEANTTLFHRDPLGRLIQKQCPDGEIINFAFNANGQLIEAVNKHRTLQFEYTPAGQISKEVQDTHILEHQYDHFGNRIETTLPSGESINYQHDYLGQLESIFYNQSCIGQFRHDAQGREVARQQGELISQWDYDPAGRLSQQKVFNGQSKQQVIRRDYYYDIAGNLNQIDDALKGCTQYSYDALNQLKTVESYVSESFNFDPAGNITQETDQSKGNRLSFYGDRHYRYDERGNLVEERRGKGHKLSTKYRYNSQNQLIAVEKDGQTFSYQYDALGRRISKKDAFGETRFLWNGDVLLSEQRASHKKLYIYEPNSFKPLAHIENNQCYFYHLDHLGTPQEVTSWDGRVVWSVKYKAYGNLALKQVEEVENNIRFQGQYFDQETGLHYNRHRYYNPNLGQFISQDPIGLLGGLNSYQYSINPITWIDPKGLTAKPGDCSVAKKRDELAHGGYYYRKQLRQEIYSAKRPEGRHATKHINAQNHEQALDFSNGIGTLDSRPEASFFPELSRDIKQIEKQAAYAAVKKGQVFDHGGARFMFHKFDEPIGYNQGKPTKWIRVELTKTGEPVIHSHPADIKNVKKYIPDAK